MDGLRAIAVSLVVAFHAFPSMVAGGFIGVDIFFVISGFLISTVIFEDLEQRRFSFTDFFGRRIRRIFPALILTMALCLGVGWFSLFANEYQQLGKHVAGGAGFISNYLLWDEKGYFDNASNTKFLLHLWSLGIEEQFYIVWPLLLWGLWKCRFNAQIVIVSLAVISFYLNTKQVTNDLTAAFYSPQTRFWELIAGAGLAYFCLYQKHPLLARFETVRGLLREKWSLVLPVSLPVVLSHLQSLVGVALVCTGVYYITEKDLFPGKWALLPVVGCVLIIAAGPKAVVNRWVLANPLLVWIGLISFPIYLFHWPLLTFARVLAEGTPPIWVRIVAIVASFILAMLTYHFVEKPVRHGTRQKPTLLALTLLMLVLGGIGYGIFKANGVPSRYLNSPNEQPNRSWKLEGPGVTSCGNLVASGKVTFFCATTPEPTVALIGDSHAGHLFYGFTTSQHPVYSKAVIVGAGACQASLGMESTDGCTEPVEAAVNLAKNTPSVKFAIIGGYFGFVDSSGSERSDEFLRGFQRTIDGLKRASKQVVFIVDGPTFKESAEKCYHPAIKVREWARDYPSFCKGATAADLKDNTEYLKFVELLRRRNPDVFFYSPQDVLCPGGVCMISKDTQILFGDDNHLSTFGSKLVASDLIRHLEAIRKN
ncbi:hypothetical protein B0B52_21920 [Polaromonas sp. A23]|nr:hypothetical protein B0B52_21920 [Polaromonas sp. A23]